MMAHELLATVATLTEATRCVVLTSSRTGNPFLGNLAIGRFQTLVSLQYDGGPDLPAEPLQGLEVVIRDAQRVGQFDIGFLDPLHSYALSLAAFRAIAGRIKRGWLIAHDCNPPYELSAEQYQTGAWCGSTYAAFRDFATASDRAWFVVDDDYGLGVMGPRKTGRLVHHGLAPELAERWGRANITTKRELFKEHGPQLMRLVSPDRAEEILTRLVRGEEVSL